MTPFLRALHSGRVLLMDGAMGTELQKAGIGEGECYELWNLTHPERVKAVHRAYAEAGAEVFLTNTFQANTGTSRHFRALELLGPIRLAGLDLARAAAGEARPVLLDLGPSATLWRNPDAWTAVGLASRAGADGILVETVSDAADVATVLKYRRRGGVRKTSLPILFSVTFSRPAGGSPRTRRGRSPEACAEEATRLGVDALGVNCGRDIGMDEVIDIIRRYRRVTDLPLFARPNAGTPTRAGEKWVYPRAPADMAARLPELLEAGVRMVGGCCGTTPAHTAAFKPVIDEWNARRPAR